MNLGGPGAIFRGTANNGVAEGFLFFATKLAVSGGARGRSGRVGTKVALLGPHLMDEASHKLPQAHEWVWGARQGKTVVPAGRMLQTPVVKHEQLSFPLCGRVYCLHDII